MADDADQWRILFAEDDQATAEILIEVLERLGWAVTHCANGELAFRAYSEKPDAYCLVLTDLVMPGGNGFDLVQKIRSRGSDVKIVVLSGFLNAKERDRLMDLATDELLSKPIDPMVLDRELRRLTGRR